LLLAARGFGDGDVSRLEQLYAAAREEEWAEFDADCGKYLAELDREERIGKYTLAELEEEEQSLDRLRRWYRELRSRDVLGIPATTDSATSLKRWNGSRPMQTMCTRPSAAPQSDHLRLVRARITPARRS
jgi:hypothetical protein